MQSKEASALFRVGASDSVVRNFHDEGRRCCGYHDAGACGFRVLGYVRQGLGAEEVRGGLDIAGESLPRTFGDSACRSECGRMCRGRSRVRVRASSRASGLASARRRRASILAAVVRVSRLAWGPVSYYSSVMQWYGRPWASEYRRGQSPACRGSTSAGCSRQGCRGQSAFGCTYRNGGDPLPELPGSDQTDRCPWP